MRSSNGKLAIEFAFRTSVDADGLTRYCYIHNDAVDAPTVRLAPGDELVLKLKNDLPFAGGTPFTHTHFMNGPDACSSGPMTLTSTNLHFHGLSIPPTCHQDDTLHTLIQPSDPAFEYHIGIPADEPPGLYWYHPHPHGFSEAQVLGGASGALIVEGMEREKPRVAGLPERVLILRDQLVPGLPDADEDAGVGKDVSLNFVPVTYPLYRPARMRVRPGEREFWRVLNAASDTFFDLQLRFGKVNQQVQNPQPLEIIALDGVPAGPNTTQTHVLLSPGARAEFIVTTPPTGAFAELVALKYDTGPDGAPIPYHVIANIIGSQDAPPTATTMPQLPALPAPWHFTGLTNLVPVRARKLYFSEVQQNPKYPEQPATYFITLDGATPKAFDMNFKKPDITVRQGTVEDWVLENRAREAHTFHIHQLHFQLLERDGHKVNEPAVRDTIDVPYWDGKSPSYPSVKIRMDFRAAQILGTFVYHCHILEHEDGGMMGAIRVVPAERSLRNDLNLPQLR